MQRIQSNVYSSMIIDLEHIDQYMYKPKFLFLNLNIWYLIFSKDKSTFMSINFKYMDQQPSK